MSNNLRHVLKGAEAAVQIARSGGRALSAADEAAFLAFRERVQLFAPIVTGVVAVSHRLDGKRFKRREGLPGPGTILHPASLTIVTMERAFLERAGRGPRVRPPTKAAVRARQQRSGVQIARIHTLLDAYAHLGRSAAKAVAAELGITSEYVRRIRALRPKQT